MTGFAKLLTSVLVALALASSVAATPGPFPSKHGTHNVRAVGQDSALKLETFHPASSFETFGTDGLDHPLARRDGFDLEGAATSFVASKLGIKDDELAFHSGFAGDISKHAFVKQQSNGISFANAVANVVFNNNGRVTSFGSSFVEPLKIADSTPTISKENAIATAEQTLDGTYNKYPTSTEYLVLDDNTAALVHVIQIQNEKAGTWYEAFVDAHGNKVLSITDFVAEATYRVIPIRLQDPSNGFQNVVNPEILAASPVGWLTPGLNATQGNNAIAFNGVTGQLTPTTSPGQFIYDQDPNADPTTPSNANAAITNAFYIINTVHDVSYLYGFTESAFNFQTDNFGRGGLGLDPVEINIQDPASPNSASFLTPSDGQSGYMRMGLWSSANPRRDSALENDVLIHEMTHGITNRMTGGGTGRCLTTLEARGLGEGWSDAMADWTGQTPDIRDYYLGQYVTNNPAGIRSHPYSTSSAVNPLTYASVTQFVPTSNEHGIGEVWANMLHNVLAALVRVYGFDTNALFNPSSPAGNAVFMHLFIDALPIQPCDPTFLQARDAWIQADANRFDGDNRCTLWRAFASRGLGTNAANYIDDGTIPIDCE